MATDKQFTTADCIDITLDHYRRLAEEGRFDNDPTLKALIIASADDRIDKVYDFLESPLA